MSNRLRDRSYYLIAFKHECGCILTEDYFTDRAEALDAFFSGTDWAPDDEWHLSVPGKKWPSRVTLLQYCPVKGITNGDMDV